MSQLKSLRGTFDLLPHQASRWQMVESLARDHLRRSGFVEIRTPLLEPTDLFRRGIGEETDVVGKEMYTFLDRGDRSCTLRPEGTASVVRAVLQHGLLNQGTQRLWYCGPMFRYERPQAGRQRQFHQIGAECFGLDSARSDAETISIAWNFLYSLGLKNLVLEINTLGSLDDRARYKSALVSWLESHYEQLDDDSKKRLKTNPLRILDSKNSAVKEILLNAPTLSDYLCIESTDRFNALKLILKALNIPFKVNPCLVRGLDYYSHTAFEIISNDLGAQATVCGGGRYDGLVEQLGGPKTPAIGWAIGLERLLILIGDSLPSVTPPDIYFVNRGEKAEIEALVLVNRLRNANFAVELDSSGASFGKQFRRADRSGAIWALVMGDEEVVRGEVQIKRLRSLENCNTPELSCSSTDLDRLLTILSN